ncbi:MAG: hypothetical protein Q9222_007101 [Ikaeria aurantiellina]
MLEREQLSSISNALATIEQLSTSSSSLDGVPSNLEASIRFAGQQLTQAAGILLRLPQQIIVEALVIFTRFYLGPEGGSLRSNSAKDVSAASLYMTAKISADPVSPRSVCNVYAYLLSEPTRRAFPQAPTPDLESYYLSEGAYYSARVILLQTETIILRALSFNVKVIAPHHLALTFLQTLGVLPSIPSSKSRALCARTVAYLNLALFSPQLLYVTHQPTTLAVAAIYLAAREVEVKLPGNEWWEVFDVDREDLGFLVVALRSCEAWIKAEGGKWSERRCPLTVEEVDHETKHVVPDNEKSNP